MSTKSNQPAHITPETPVFPKEIHHPHPPVAAVLPHKKHKEENVFSRSKDLREDRDARQVKTSQNPQTLPHGGH